MNKRIITLLSIIIMGSSIASAQTSGGNSPYSRYGWGTLTDGGQGFNKGMGGVALGFKGRDILNYANPASYASIDSITFLFDIGISLQNGYFKENDKSVNALNSTLDYIQAGFRLRKNLGVSIGLKPVSIVSYDFYNNTALQGEEGIWDEGATTSSSYYGEGGMRNAWLGLGWEPVKNLAIGVNGGFTWGNYTHTNTITFTNNAHSLLRTYKASINTYSLDFGLQYTKSLGKKNELTIGLTYGLGHDINSTATYFNREVASSSSTTLGGDTTRVSKAFEMPHSFGIGFNFCHDKKLSVGVDYTCQLWKGCKFPELASTGSISSYTVGTSSFCDRHRIAVGAQYIPNPDGYKVKDHIQYKLGLSYTTPYVKVNGQDGPKSYLGSVGVGIPITNTYSSRSLLNIGFQWEHIAPSASHLLKEDYVRLCLGLTFNANWFNKWRIE